MKTWNVILGLMLLAGTVHAAPLPNNEYFKAMQDEMKRSMAKLHQPGVEKPYFIAYKLEQITWGNDAEASLGSLYPREVRDSKLNAFVWVDIGNAKKDSMGFAHAAYMTPYAYRPRLGSNLPKSYSGIRQTLWQLTDMAYTFAAETYQQKEAYKRSKQADGKKKLPDVIPAKQASYTEKMMPLPDPNLKQIETWVKEQSAVGKKYPFVEQFEVGVFPARTDTYYLNSRGGFYQTSLAAVQIEWKAKIRDKNGFKRQYRRALWLQDFSPQNQALAATYTNIFADDLQTNYAAVEGKKYVGPVLLTAEAAGPFIYEQLVQNFQNLKLLAYTGDEEDPSAGKFNTPGQRVMAPGITVWDEPLARNNGDVLLGGFMPVDDEGVSAQTLKLVEQGHIVDLPRTTRPLEDKQLSNGHARATQQSMPRERLTNVRLDPQSPRTWDDLLRLLRDKCQELGLEYGYILHQWPTADNENKPVLQRVYVDGRSEFVYGLRIDGLTTRSLRDILSTGDSPVITRIETSKNVGVLPTQNVTTPALLIEELELIPTEAKPDKPPFVPKP